MNKMLTPNGGVPLRLTDLDFMQTAVFDSFKAFLKGFKGDGNIRLTGCEVKRDENKTTWTDGFIALGGEIFEVSAGSITISKRDRVGWKIIRTREAEVVLENGTTAARRERSYAQLSANMLETVVDDLEVKTLSDYIFITKANSKRYDIETLNATEYLATAYIRVQDHPDFTRTYYFMFYFGGKASLENGKMCDYKSTLPLDGSFFDCVLKEDPGSGDRFKPCILSLQKGSVFLFDRDGAPITSVDYPAGITLSINIPKNKF